MSSINVLNTDAGLNGKTLVTAESTQSISGPKTLTSTLTVNAAINATGNINTTAGVGAVTGIFEFSRGVPSGVGIAVSYADNLFAGDAVDGNWVVASEDMVNFRYRLMGNTILISLSLTGTTVAGTPTALQVTIPGGFTAAHDEGGVAFSYNAAVYAPCQWHVFAAGSVIHFTKLPAATWGTEANLTQIQASIAFEIN